MRHLLKGCVGDEHVLALMALSARARAARGTGFGLAPLIVAVLNLFALGLAEGAFRGEADPAALAWIFLLESAAMAALMLALSAERLFETLRRTEQAGLTSRQRLLFLILEFTFDPRLVALGASTAFAAIAAVRFRPAEAAGLAAVVACWWCAVIAAGCSVLAVARRGGHGPGFLAAAGGCALLLVLLMPPGLSGRLLVPALPLSGWTAEAARAAASGATGVAALWVLPSALLASAFFLHARTKG
jgi:hypothetical protein